MMFIKAASCAIAFLFSALLMAGTPHAADLRQLEGTWDLVKAGDRVLPGTHRHLPFFTLSHRMISGFDGCNRFGGPLDQPGKIVRGQRGCSGHVVKLPLDLQDPAAHLRAGRLHAGTLELPPRSGFPASKFRRR